MFSANLVLLIGSYQEEIDKHEAAIKANNTELMMRIRSGPDDESDNLRTEVENLAANCTKLAKVNLKSGETCIDGGARKGFRGCGTDRSFPHRGDWVLPVL